MNATASLLPHRAQAAAALAADPQLAAAVTARAARTGRRWRAMRPRTEQQAWADFDAAEAAEDARKVRSR